MDYALGCSRFKALRSRSNRLHFRFVSSEGHPTRRALRGCGYRFWCEGRVGKWWMGDVAHLMLPVHPQVVHQH